MATGEREWDFPTNRDKAEEVRIKLEKAEVSKWFPDETTVTFVLGGTKYHGWMPEYAVNIENKWLKAFIVGDFANGDWEIFIPDETLQSTKFLRVPEADQNTVVVAGWWQ